MGFRFEAPRSEGRLGFRRKRRPWGCIRGSGLPGIQKRNLGRKNKKRRLWGSLPIPQRRRVAGDRRRTVRLLRLLAG